MKPALRSFLLVGVLALSGCAALIRNQCEKINWFERGQNLALAGQYPANDPQITECRKVEAKINESQLDLGFKRGRELYCHPERAFLTGKEGKIFATDICDQSLVSGLVKKYAQGVRAYCVPETAQQLGASGEKYNSICPADLEVSFKKAYSRARVGYLEGRIPGLQNEISQKQMQVANKRNEISFLEGQKAVLSGQLAQARASYAGESQAHHIESQVSSLQGQIQMKQQEIKDLENQMNAAVSQISNYQGEISGLKERN